MDALAPALAAAPDATCSGCSLRTFVLPCHKARPLGNYCLSDLAVGRLDLVARCSVASLFISFGVRRNTVFRVTLFDGAQVSPPRTVTFEGRRVTSLRLTERSFGAIMMRRLGACAPNARKLMQLGAEAVAVSDKCLAGVSVADNQGLRDNILSAIAQHHAAHRGQSPVLLLLTEDAPFIEDVMQEHSRQIQAGGVIVLLGDNRGLTAEEETMCCKLVESHGVTLARSSMGSVSLLASHCIVLVHHYLDGCVHTCPPPSAAGRYVVQRQAGQSRESAYHEYFHSDQLTTKEDAAQSAGNPA